MMQMPGRSADAFDEFEAALECQPDYGPALKVLQERQPGR